MANAVDKGRRQAAFEEHDDCPATLLQMDVQVWSALRCTGVTDAADRSRWMIPCSCVASSPSAVCVAIGSPRQSGSVRVRVAARGPRPRQTPSRAPLCRSLLRCRRFRRCSGDSETPASSLPAGIERDDPHQSRRRAGRTFHAMSRPSLPSFARYTSPIPPMPMRPMTSKPPSRMPGVRGKIRGRLHQQRLAVG
jgi:hypothetical protein